LIANPDIDWLRLVWVVSWTAEIPKTRHWIKRCFYPILGAIPWTCGANRGRHRVCRKKRVRGDGYFNIIFQI